MAAVGGWSLGQKYQLLQFAPFAVTVATIVQRTVAARRGQLNTSLALQR